MITSWSRVIRVVGDEDVSRCTAALLDPAVAELAATGARHHRRHDAELRGQVLGLADELAAGAEDRAGVVEHVVDDRRVGAAAQRQADPSAADTRLLATTSRVTGWQADPRRPSGLEALVSSIALSPQGHLLLHDDRALLIDPRDVAQRGSARVVSSCSTTSGPG